MKNIFSILAVLFLMSSCSKSKKEAVSYADHSVTSPELFAPGIISTNQNNEFDLCFTPDGRTVYFTRRFGEEKQKIYVTHLKKGKWTKPEIAIFSTDRDETPYISPDGKTFYFGSQREIPGKPNLGGFDMNVWQMNKTEDGWSAPVPLPEPINQVQLEGENWPSSNNNFFFTRDGIKYYFTTMKRGSKAIDIYTTEKSGASFRPPERIEGLFENDSLWKYSASVSPDGQYLVFNSYGAPQGIGGEDLYVSKKTDTGWSMAKNMGDLINTPGEDSSGRFSPDGKYFFYTHADNLGNDEYSTWSIYFLETQSLNLDSLFK